MVIWRMGF